MLVAGSMRRFRPHSLSAVAAGTCEDQAATVVRVPGVVEAVVAAMEAHEDMPDVQLDACRTLAILARGTSADVGHMAVR